MNGGIIGGIIGTILIRIWRQANRREDTMAQSSSCLKGYPKYSAFLKHWKIGGFSIQLIHGIYSNEPLKRSLEKFAKFPIATSYQNNEPRLLLVSVDVQEGSTVVFDSYEKEDGTRKTEYGRYGPEFARGPNDREGFEHVISHNDGIEVDLFLQVVQYLLITIILN